MSSDVQTGAQRQADAMWADDRASQGLGIRISAVAPVQEGELLVAEAVERVLRGRSGLYDVTVRRDGETVLEFRGRSRTLPGTSSPPPESGA